MFSTAVLLFVAAALLFLGAMSPSRAIDLPDHFLFLRGRAILWIVGGLFLSLSALLLLGRDVRMHLLLVASVGCTGLVYHFGTLYCSAPNLFAALGNWAEWAPIQPKTMRWVVGIFLAWLFLGSGALLIREWAGLRAKAAQSGVDLKSNAGQTIETA